MAEHVERFLIVRTDRLGDVVLTLPMLSILRKTYPRAFIAMLLSRYTGEIVEGNPYLDKILWYDDGEIPLPFGSMLEHLREGRFDAVVVVHPTLRLARLMFRARIPVRIGTGYRYYSFLFNRKVYEHRKDARRHELEYNLRLLEQLGCHPEADIRSQDFAIQIPADAADRVARRLQSLGVEASRRIVILHPGSGGSAKEWPLASFGKLALRLSADPTIQIVVTGSGGEETLAQAIVRATSGKAVSLAGAFEVKELAALCAGASLFIANSTGPLHIAAAIGTPVIGLYPQLTAMSPNRWGPYTARKRVYVPDKAVDCRDCAGDTGRPCACMASIAVDDVLRGARELLESRESMKRNIT